MSTHEEDIGPELQDDSYQDTWLMNAGESPVSITDQDLKDHLNQLKEINDAANMEDKLFQCPSQSFVNPHFEAPLGVCTCIGSIYGEPYCPCRMKHLELSSDDLHMQAKKEFAYNLSLYGTIRFP